MSDSIHKTHFVVPELPWKKRKKTSKLRFAEFKHQIESRLLVAEISREVMPKQLKTAQEWLDWLSKTYKKANEESL